MVSSRAILPNMLTVKRDQDRDDVQIHLEQKPSLLLVIETLHQGSHFCCLGVGTPFFNMLLCQDLLLGELAVVVRTAAMVQMEVGRWVVELVRHLEDWSSRCGVSRLRVVELLVVDS